MCKLFFALIFALAPWDLAAWTPVTEQCSTVSGDILIMECQSAGLVSKQAYTGAIHVSVDVLASPIGTTDQYWAGLALNSDVAGDSSYAEVALTKGIAPFNDVGPSAVLLSTTGKSNCCQVVKAIDPAAWHTLTIDYAAGRATYTVDGTARTVRVKLASTYAIELLCVAVNPGTSVPGALTRCSWRNLSVVTR